jgi:putative PIG3 family NAD(P)H quinone oxidoreductase
MKCVEIIEGNLKYTTRSIPVSKPGEKLIKIQAAGINRADLLQLKGLYPAPDNGTIPGLEIAGIIENEGQQCAALLTGSGYSEYVAVNEQLIMPLPKRWSIIEAAAAPEALVTVWLNLFKLGQLKKGERVLIHGATSGIGSMAIQLAIAQGAEVWGTVGAVTPQRLEFCEKLGLQKERLISYQEDFVSLLKEVEGVDIVLDILGGKYLDASLSVLRKYGRLASIAVMQGSKTEINMGRVLMKNLTIIGSTLRSKSDEEKGGLIKEVVQYLYPLMEAHDIRPSIDSTFSLTQVECAFARLESREHCGKIVLEVS